jgi:hypothetical protein
MPDHSGAYFKVTYFPKEVQKLRTWAAQAQVLRILPEFADALRTIDQRLADDPLRWGDPTNRLHYLGLLKHLRIYQFLRIYYAVDEVRRIVYVTDVLPMSGHPLEGGG